MENELPVAKPTGSVGPSYEVSDPIQLDIWKARVQTNGEDFTGPKFLKIMNRILFDYRTRQAPGPIIIQRYVQDQESIEHCFLCREYAYIILSIPISDIDRRSFFFCLSHMP